jgi:exonuclease SbcC
VILAEMTIENYKQFQGPHVVRFPSTGIIGVIGANGAGKTTLFEAIEWCLYNPSTIANPDVVPRGTAERTRVTLTLEDPHDGSRYVVVRTLRGGKTSTAEVFREDEPENRITQGPREVTRHVSSRLIGLGHTAFVSTFFTRQKELSFFGNMSATDRRVAVAKLLGYETIRSAQKQLGEERTRAKNAAEALRTHYEEQVAGRDFAAEATEADAAVIASERDVSTKRETLEKAVARLHAASEEAERWRDLERRDAALGAELGRIEGTILASEDRRASAIASLADLDAQAATCAELAALSSRLPERQKLLAEQDSSRERFEQARRLEEALQRAEASLDRSVQSARQAVLTAQAGVIDQWVWRGTDDADPVVATVRLQGVARGLAHLAARDSVATFDRLRDLAADADQKRDHHARCRRTLDAIRSKIADILATGDPQQAIESARQAREQANLEATTIAAEISNLSSNRLRLEKIVTTLEQMAFAEPASLCPTCQRPFSPDEADATIDALNQRIAESRRDESSARDRERRARARADAAAKALAEAEDQQRLLSDERSRLSKGEGVTSEAENAAGTAAQALEIALVRAERKTVPDAAECQRAREQLERFERVLRAAETLRQIEGEARAHSQEAEAARDAITTLGAISYDERQHHAARVAVDEARDAASRVAEIERRLSRRPEFETMQADAESQLAHAREEHTNLSRQRDALGFSLEHLDAAIQAETAARAVEREALDALSRARASHADNLSRREALVQEHDRIKGLARRADSLVREQETLHLVYDEFTAFDRYVADRVTPYLAEQTSELLGTVTDGRYDHVHFDKDYGLRIYDGPIDSFPVTAFSGGERDVAALCARLALSRVVGAQAANPPSFLVLDEVFGALDQERRAQVLQTLGVLSGTAEAFRQLFIISHVDDIRQSSVFDEVWRVSEGADGSYIERIDQLGALEEA